MRKIVPLILTMVLMASVSFAQLSFVRTVEKDKALVPTATDETSKDLAVVLVNPIGYDGLVEVLPSAIVKNVGTDDATTGFNISFVIFDGENNELYNKNKDFSDAIASGDSSNFDMDVAWAPTELGVYKVMAVVTFADDEDRNNDTLRATYTILKDLLWGKNKDYTGSSSYIVSTNLGGLAPDPTAIETADDFSLPEGTWAIHLIETSGILGGEDIPVDGFYVTIYADNAGVPGDTLFQELIPELNTKNQALIFSKPVVLNGETVYWLSVMGHYNIGDDAGKTRWNWKMWNNLILNGDVIRDAPDAFGAGLTDWTYLSALGIADQSTDFAIYGEAPNTENDILAYSFPKQTGPATINADLHTINIEVALSADLANLVADFTLSNYAYAQISSIDQKSGVTSNDFSDNGGMETYTVVAEDGTTQDWTVTVTQATTNQTGKDITAYSFEEQTGDAIINTTDHTVNIEVAYGTSLDALIATFTLSPVATATVGAIDQESGVTPNNFSDNGGEETYTVKAEDGSVQDWTVKVTVAAPNDDATLSDLTVDGSTVTDFASATLEYRVVLAAGSDVPSVVGIPTDANATLVVTDATSVPGTTTIEVTAEDGTTKLLYKVNFEAPNNDAKLSDLTVSGTTVEGFSPYKKSYNVVLSEGTTVVPPVDGTLSDLNASYVVTDATALPGTTKIDVTAEDGTTVSQYKVNFTVSTSISKLSNPSVNIYPNPTTGLVNIEGLESAQLIIYNTIGEEIYNEKNISTTIIVDMSSYSAGNYIVKIITNNNVMTQKIILTK